MSFLRRHAFHFSCNLVAWALGILVFRVRYMYVPHDKSCPWSTSVIAWSHTSCGHRELCVSPFVRPSESRLSFVVFVGFLCVGWRERPSLNQCVADAAPLIVLLLSGLKWCFSSSNSRPIRLPSGQTRKRSFSSPSASLVSLIDACNLMSSHPSSLQPSGSYL